jgi:hypothetical protein
MVPFVAEVFFLFLKSFHGLVNFIKLLLLVKRLSHEFVVVRSKLVESISVLAIVVMVLVGVILHFSLDFSVSSRGHFGEVHFFTDATLDFLDMTLECLISVPEESNLVVAVCNGIVKAVQADSVTDLLELVLAVVAGINVFSLSLDLSILVLSVTVRSLDVAELLLVSGVDIRLLGNSVFEKNGVVISRLDGFLGVAVVVVDEVLHVVIDIKSLLVVSDLKVEVDSVLSPDNGGPVASDLEFLDPVSQKSKKSTPVIVSGHTNKQVNLEHDISVNSEISRDVLVDFFDMLSLRDNRPINCTAEIAAFNVRNYIVLVVGISLGVVVSATFRHCLSVLLLKFLVLALVVRRSSLEY